MKRCSFEWIACGSCRHPAYMTDRQASLCPTDFPSYVGIIRHPDKGIVLFDTGYDQSFIQATHSFPERLYRWATPVTIHNTIAETLAEKGIKHDEVKAVILSHFHGDHIAGLHHFPQATIYCSQTGLQHLRSKSRLSLTRQGILSSLLPADVEQRAVFFKSLSTTSLPAAFTPFNTATDLLGDGSLLAVELPGHCPGHWGLALRTEDDCYLFLIGDAVWSINSVEQYSSPPRITTAWLGNTAQYRQTLQQLHQCRQHNSELRILPSHCQKAAERWGNP